MTAKTPPVPLAFPPIVVGKDKPTEVTADMRAEWKKTADSFKRNPNARRQFATDLTDLTMVRLRHLMESATSPSVMMQTAKIIQVYVEFAYRGEKE